MRVKNTSKALDKRCHVIVTFSELGSMCGIWNALQKCSYDIRQSMFFKSAASQRVSC